MADTASNPNGHIDIDAGENYVDISVGDEELINLDIDDANGVTVHVHEVTRSDDATARFNWSNEVFTDDDT